MKVPQIIFDELPELPEFSAFAWKCAAEHITNCDGAPQSPYMDEGFAPDRIWIWDTCFMSLYCKYAPADYPGIESLNNFYSPMLDGIKTPLKIHIPDNPPLFAWAEMENFRMTGNRKRLENIFLEKRYPQRMFHLYENFRAGERFDYMTSIFPVQWEKTPFGYHWSGGRCGMDNTPRGGYGWEVMDNDPAYRKVLFLDAAAQQALSAEIIYEITGETEFRTEFDRLKELLNNLFWDDKDGCYYDIQSDEPHERIRVLTPASFWPLLAGIASQEQAERMAEHLKNPEELGGIVPFPSVARNSPYFNPAGEYWRGGVWLPTAYMCVKALERYKLYELADELAERLVMHMFRTWREFEPHTIWESYSPSEFKPSTVRRESSEPYSRPDFCGWSALGPINLVIENMLGIHAGGVKNKVVWRIHRTCRHGIRNLQFGGNTVSMIFDGSYIETESSGAFELETPYGNFNICEPGKFRFKIQQK